MIFVIVKNTQAPVKTNLLNFIPIESLVRDI